jgi:hypothetical protein
MHDNKSANSSKKSISGVHCDVSNCIYNEQGCKCCADKIDVGPEHADNSSETVCSTFQAL